MGHLRPYYKLASHNVHSNPKGIYQKLGLTSGSRVLLAGASDAGLSLPGQSAAISLLQASSALSLLHPVLDGIIATRLMGRFCTEISESFSRVSQECAEKKSSPSPGRTDPPG